METNNSQAVITLPLFTPSETKHVAQSLATILYHALLADDAVNVIGYEALADGFYLLENTIQAIPVCAE